MEMETAIEAAACRGNGPASSLAMKKESHLIAKLKPKIRIIHIFAPEVIKTDAANFRELVQKLTGKPVGRKSGKKRARNVRYAPNSGARTEESSRCKSAENSTTTTGYRSMDSGDQVKGEGEEEEEEEVEMWGCGNSSFLGGLGDLDGFMQGLGEFSFGPVSSTTHVDAFGHN